MPDAASAWRSRAARQRRLGTRQHARAGDNRTQCIEGTLRNFACQGVARGPAHTCLHGREAPESARLERGGRAPLSGGATQRLAPYGGRIRVICACSREPRSGAARGRPGATQAATRLASRRRQVRAQRDLVAATTRQPPASPRQRRRRPRGSAPVARVIQRAKTGLKKPTLLFYFF